MIALYRGDWYPEKAADLTVCKAGVRLTGILFGTDQIELEFLEVVPAGPGQFIALSQQDLL